MKLVHKETGAQAYKGDALHTFRGKFCILKDTREPEHTGSTGRIIVDMLESGQTMEFYPSVCDLEWRDS